jgi:hypothetical protein
MPRFTQVNLPIEEAKADLEKIIRNACGGALCVKLRTEARDDSAESCRYVRAEPDLNDGAVVDRETTIVLVTGTLPCQPDSSPQDSPQPGDSGTPGEGQPSVGTS